MKRERVLVIVLTVTAVFTLLFTSLATADNLTPQPAKEEPKTTIGGGQAITFMKTVGTDPSNCANSQTIVVSSDTEVAYCYAVTNTGSLTLTVHDLEDSELGPIFSQLSVNLVPNSTIWLTQTAVITTTTINTATWTAYNPGPTNTVTYAAAATVIISNLNTCRFPNLPIPDNNVTGTVATMNVTTAGTIADLNVYLETDHTWVGDLKFTLEHVSSGITATLIDRPGEPASTFGCSSNGIRAIMDDEADAAAETSCGPPNLALAGHFAGGDPANNTLLAAFDSQELMGQWNLHVSDNEGGDAGILNSWCLLPTLAEADISLNPTALSAMQLPDMQTTQILNLRNSGNVPLDWTIYESSEEATAVYDPAAFPPITVLYDNGPLVNMPGAGAGGADASVVQDNSLGMSTFGFAHQAALGNSVADDFTVTDANGWYIDEITFFAYQTNSPLTSTITAVNYRIWDGAPDDPASNIVLGQTLPNRLIDTTWSGSYRVRETTLPATTRPIMQNTASGDIVLSPGTYWLEWQAEGTLLSGPWAPSITISNVATTWQRYAILEQCLDTYG